MSSSSDNRGGSNGSADPASRHSPSGWLDALTALFEARFDLIRLEARISAADKLKRAALLAIAAACVFMAWPLLVAGVISVVSGITGLHWSWLAIGAAFAHLLAAILFAKLAKPAAGPSFPVTRAEFQKDCEWLKNFSKIKNSNG